MAMPWQLSANTNELTISIIVMHSSEQYRRIIFKLRGHGHVLQMGEKKLP
jgi:hypothetical protein